MNLFKVLTRVTFSILTVVLGRYLLRRRRYHPLTPGNVALITGGGSGIGLAVAHIFASGGCHVILVGRNKEALSKAREYCLAHGAYGAEIVVADLKEPQSIEPIKAAVEQHGRLNYLVLNAGVGAIAPFTGDSRFYNVCEEVMQINYFTNVRLLQLLLPMLEKVHTPQDPSRVIVMSSLAGILPSTFRSAYTASKHAIQGFMNALRGETKVYITLCCPGYVDTAFHERAQIDKKDSQESHRRGVPPEVCAHQCIDGALHGDSEVLTTISGKLGYMLRPFFTKFIDSQAQKMSIRSLQK